MLSAYMEVISAREAKVASDPIKANTSP